MSGVLINPISQTCQILFNLTSLTCGILPNLTSQICGILPNLISQICGILNRPIFQTYNLRDGRLSLGPVVTHPWEWVGVVIIGAVTGAPHPLPIPATDLQSALLDVTYSQGVPLVNLPGPRVRPQCVVCLGLDGSSLHLSGDSHHSGDLDRGAVT